jgi:hypothetical protein
MSMSDANATNPRRRRPRLARVASLLFVALLAGCGADRIVAPTAGLQIGQRAALFSTREVVVVGQPPDGASAEAIASLLRFPGRRDAPFTVVPPPGDGSRLVVLFGPRSANACTAPRGGAEQLPLTMTIAFCIGGSEANAATLYSDTLVGPSDPAFQRRLDSMMLSLSRTEPRKLVD